MEFTVASKSKNGQDWNYDLQTDTGRVTLTLPGDFAEPGDTLKLSVSKSLKAKTVEKPKEEKPKA